MIRPVRNLLLIAFAAGLVACDSPGDDVTIGRHGDDHAVELQKRLTDLQSPNISRRAQAAHDLAKIELADAAAFVPLKNLLHDDPEAGVRASAAHALRAGVYVEATEELVQCVRYEGDQRVRDVAVRSLGVRRDPAALSLFHGVLANAQETPEFRRLVLEAVGAYRTRDAMRLICRAAGYDHSEASVKEAALDQLSQQGHEAVPYFLSYLRDEGFTISTATVDAWRRDDPDNVMPMLVRAYRQKVRVAGYRYAQKGTMFP